MADYLLMRKDEEASVCRGELDVYNKYVILPCAVYGCDAMLVVVIYPVWPPLDPWS